MPRVEVEPQRAEDGLQFDKTTELGQEVENGVDIGHSTTVVLATEERDGISLRTMTQLANTDTGNSLWYLLCRCEYSGREQSWLHHDCSMAMWTVACDWLLRTTDRERERESYRQWYDNECILLTCSTHCLIIESIVSQIWQTECKFLGSIASTLRSVMKYVIWPYYDRILCFRSNSEMYYAEWFLLQSFLQSFLKRMFLCWNILWGVEIVKSLCSVLI